MLCETSGDVHRQIATRDHQAQQQLFAASRTPCMAVAGCSQGVGQPTLHNNHCKGSYVAPWLHALSGTCKRTLEERRLGGGGGWKGVASRHQPHVVGVSCQRLWFEHVRPFLCSYILPCHVPSLHHPLNHLIASQQKHTYQPH